MFKKILIFSVLFFYSFLSLADDFSFTKEISTLTKLIGENEETVIAYMKKTNTVYTIENILDNNSEVDLNSLRKLIYTLPYDNHIIVEIDYSQNKVYFVKLRIAYKNNLKISKIDKNVPNIKDEQQKALEKKLAVFLTDHGWSKRELVALLGFSIIYEQDIYTLKIEKEKELESVLDITISTDDLTNDYEMAYLIEEKANNRKNRKLEILP